MRRFLPLIIISLSVAGLAVAGFSLAHKQSFVSGAFCTLGETFNCDVVNKGPYSELFGIPVALIGVVGYGLIAAAAFMHHRNPEDRGFPAFILLSSVGGMGFSGYLTGIEAFVLQTWCLLCLTSQTIMAALLVAAIVLWQSTRKKTSVPEVPPAA